jgi:HSP20 family molecular chaperone IbpA
MASQFGNRYGPSHVTLSDPASPIHLFRSLVHYIDDPIYYHHTPETDKGHAGHAKHGAEHAEQKAEHVLVHRWPHHLQPHHRGIATPSFDIHETTTCFFLEGDFPGIADKKDIVIEKVGPRSFAIEARSPRFSLHDEWASVPRSGLFKYENQTLENAEESLGGKASGAGEPEKVQFKEKEEEEEIVPELELEAGETVRAPSWIQMDETKTLAQHEEGVRTWISERHIGKCGRSFTFPVPLDYSALKARFSNGLLRIMVPKLETKVSNERQRIPIE